MRKHSPQKARKKHEIKLPISGCALCAFSWLLILIRSNPCSSVVTLFGFYSAVYGLSAGLIEHFDFSKRDSKVSPMA